MSDGRAWGWFGAWAAVGALVALTILGALSIGVFVLPFAVLGIWLVGRRSPSRRTAFGLVSGAGLTCLGVYAGNGGSSEGFDATPYLVAGIVLVLAGAGLFALLGRRGRPARVG
jgi:hypothetical protein